MVRGAVMAEDASAHAAVVFAVPEGEGCATGVAGVCVLIVDPRVWQPRWDVHMFMEKYKDVYRLTLTASE